ncbi:MAG: AAA family ATPase [Thermodesulfobacteriota bacterium]
MSSESAARAGGGTPTPRDAAVGQGGRRDGRAGARAAQLARELEDLGCTEVRVLPGRTAERALAVHAAPAAGADQRATLLRAARERAVADILDEYGCLDRRDRYVVRPSMLERLRALGIERPEELLPDPLPSSTSHDDEVPPPGAEDDRDGGAPGILAADVRRERVRWLWPGRVPLGKVTIVSGDPDRGKTTVMLDVGSRVTHGRLMPDGTPGLGEPAGIVVISAEDDAGDTLRPRLEAAGADLSRALIVRMHELPTIPDELGLIEAAVDRVNAKLVVVDPMMAVLGDHIDAHRDHHIRRALTPLAELASRLQVALVLIRHLRKAESANAQYRGGGSIGITAAARSELLVAPDPDDETGERRVLARIKGNLSAPVPSLTYRLVPRELAALEDDEDQSPHWSVAVEWTGRSERTADQLLAQPDAPEERYAVDAAADYLTQVLTDGPQPSTEVHSGASAAGISRPTLWRAKQRVGVRARVAPWRDWYWSLPASGDTYYPAEQPPTAADERRDAEETAAARLGVLVAYAEPPITRRRAEDTLLRAAGIGRNRARDVIEGGDGVLWRVVAGGGRGQPTVLRPPATETSPPTVSGSSTLDGDTPTGEVSGGDAEAPENQEQPDLFAAYGHRTETSPPTVSGSSTLDGDTPTGEVSAIDRDGPVPWGGLAPDDEREAMSEVLEWLLSDSEPAPLDDAPTARRGVDV